MNKELIKERTKDALRIVLEIQSIYNEFKIETCIAKLPDIEPNPFYNQLDESSNGFICEDYYGSPSKIYSPLGYMRIYTNYMSNSESLGKAIEKIHNTFGFDLKQSENTTIMGVFGAWWNITKLPWKPNDKLTNAIEREKKDYIDYKNAKEIWNEILYELNINEDISKEYLIDKLLFNK